MTAPQPATTTVSLPSPSTPGPDSSWTWRTLRTAPLDGGIVPAFDGRLLVTSTEFGSGGTDLAVTDARTGLVGVRYDTPAGYAVRDVWLSGRWLLVEETAYQPGRHEVRLYRIELATGRVERLDRLPMPTDPSIDVAGNVLAYVAGDRSGQRCVYRVRVDTLRLEGSGCVRPPTVLGDPVVSPDGTVTFSVDEARRCKRLFRWTPGATHPVRIPAVRDCVQWSGAVVGRGELWSEVHDLAYSRGYARGNDGKAIDLGLIVTDTIRSCGGWIYWNGLVGGRVQGLYRWRPGSAAELRYAAPDADTKATPIKCSGNQLTLRVDRPPLLRILTHPAS